MQTCGLAPNETTARVLHLPAPNVPHLRPRSAERGAVGERLSVQETAAYRPVIHQQQDRPGDSDDSRTGVVRGREGTGGAVLLINRPISVPGQSSKLPISHF